MASHCRARFLDRPSNQILTAYTQFTDGTGWSDYFLAPYTCFN